jgi:hypothetical protein
MVSGRRPRPFRLGPGARARFVTNKNACIGVDGIREGPAVTTALVA